jgi:hypothetical protein
MRNAAAAAAGTSQYFKRVSLAKIDAVDINAGSQIDPHSTAETLATVAAASPGYRRTQASATFHGHGSGRRRQNTLAADKVKFTWVRGFKAKCSAAKERRHAERHGRRENLPCPGPTCNFTMSFVEFTDVILPRPNTFKTESRHAGDYDAVDRTIVQFTRSSVLDIPADAQYNLTNT